jgi:PLP dependent protein
VPAVDPAAVAANVEAVRHRIAAAGGSGVEIVAVTKGFGSDAVRAAVAAGCRIVAESYAQEAVAKFGDPSSCVVPGRPRPEIHFIGRLQTNKVRALAHIVDRWDSVDRPALIEEIARRAPSARILVQVNTSGEESKAGVDPSGVAGLIDHARSSGLRVEGLMTIGPLEGDHDDVVESFGVLRRLVDEHGLPSCSMGMSDDLETAVACGSTEVRVGRALFGERPPRAMTVG